MGIGISVHLNASEMMLVAPVGCRRNISTICKGIKAGNTGGTPDMDAWACHINGAAGELAAAKALNLYWDGSVDSFRSRADVGLLEVRTRSSHAYDLIVRDQDSDDSIFILVTGSIPDFVVRGWCRGGWAKQEQYLQTHGGFKPAYFVPQSDLKPIEELRR